MPGMEHVWIFSKAGLPIVDFAKDDKKINKNLLGFALTSIRNYCNKTSGKHIKSFGVGEHNFTCIPSLDENIVLVIKSSEGIKRKHVLKTAKIINKIFEDMFTIKDIQNWSGDVAFFKNFKSKLDLYFKMGNL